MPRMGCFHALILAMGLSSVNCTPRSQLFNLSSNPNDIHFYLYPSYTSPITSQEIVYNNLSSLSNTSFQPNQKTVILVHGFTQNYTSPMPQVIKNAYLNAKLGYNIILVDWGPLSTPYPVTLADLNYYFVVKNVPIVAERIAEFIQFLIKHTPARDFHLVGHSLGARVAGRVGYNMKHIHAFTIPRITGLEPAGPLFSPLDKSLNLVKTNAEFVDVIHTNGWGYGEETIIGHVDFYPNGGVAQPNCSTHEFFRSFANTCSHQFAWVLYAASLSQSFPACPCQESGYLLATCKGLIGTTLSTPISCPTNQQVLMGYPCPTTARGTYYIKTTNPP